MIVIVFSNLYNSRDNLGRKVRPEAREYAPSMRVSLSLKRLSESASISIKRRILPGLPIPPPVTSTTHHEYRRCTQH